MATGLTQSQSGLAIVGGNNTQVTPPAPIGQSEALNDKTSGALSPGEFNNTPPVAPATNISVVSPNSGATDEAAKAKQVVNNATTTATTNNQNNQDNGSIVNNTGANANSVTQSVTQSGVQPTSGVTIPATGNMASNNGSLTGEDYNGSINSVLNTPDTGNQFFWDASGNRIEAPIGSTPPSGFTPNSPASLGQGVLDMVTTNSGSTIKQLKDGTYQIFGVDGNPVGPTTAAEFYNIKAGQQALTAFNNFLSSGGTTLNANQQSQISAIQQQYAALIQKQTVANANLTGGTTVAENMYGMGNTLIGQGAITGTVTDGIQKIADLTSKMNSDISNMTQGFEKDNLALVQSGYNAYKDSSDAVQKSIDTFQAAVQKQISQLAAETASTNDAFSKKYQDTTTPILPTDTADQLKAKLQTSPSYLQDQKTKQGQVDQNVLDGMLKIYHNTGAIPAGMGNASVELKKAFYAAIGGTPALADQATINKAALTAATKSLTTQQTQYNATQTSVGTMKSSIDRLDSYIKPLVDTGSPVVNGLVRDLSGKVLGSTTYSAFENELNTVATEYAKVLSGASASVSGVSVSSVDDIKKAFNDKVTVNQLDTVLTAIKQDINARLVSQKSTINQIQSDITQMSDSGTTSTSGTTTGTGGFATAW